MSDLAYCDSGVIGPHHLALPLTRARLHDASRLCYGPCMRRFDGRKNKSPRFSALNTSDAYHLVDMELYAKVGMADRKSLVYQ